MKKSLTYVQACVDGSHTFPQSLHSPSQQTSERQTCFWNNFTSDVLVERLLGRERMLRMESEWGLETKGNGVKQGHKNE